MKEYAGQQKWKKYPRKCRHLVLSRTDMHSREGVHVGKIVMMIDVKRMKGRLKRRLIYNNE